jgi:hypothetical protein
MNDRTLDEIAAGVTCMALNSAASIGMAYVSITGKGVYESERPTVAGYSVACGLATLVVGYLLCMHKKSRPLDAKKKVEWKS